MLKVLLVFIFTSLSAAACLEELRAFLHAGQPYIEKSQFKKEAWPALNTLAQNYQISSLLDHSLAYKANQLPSVQEVEKYLQGNSIDHPFFKSYEEHLHRVQMYRKSLKGTEQSKAWKKVKRFEYVSNRCHATQDELDLGKTQNQLTRANLLLGLNIPFFTYLDEHKDEKKDMKWWGKFTFDLGVILAQNFAFAKVVGEKQMHWLMGTVVSFAMYNGIASGANYFLYEPLLDDRYEKAELSAEELLLSATYKSEVENLIEIVEDPKLPELFKKKFAALLQAHSLGSLENLKEHRAKEILIELIASKSYMQQFGAGKPTGRISIDKIKSDLFVDAVTTPFDVIVTVAMYRSLCRGLMNPKSALIKAMGIYALWNAAFNKFNYYYRKKTVGI